MLNTLTQHFKQTLPDNQFTVSDIQDNDDLKGKWFQIVSISNNSKYRLPNNNEIVWYDMIEWMDEETEENQSQYFFKTFKKFGSEVEEHFELPEKSILKLIEEKEL